MPASLAALKALILTDLLNGSVIQFIVLIGNSKAVVERKTFDD